MNHNDVAKSKGIIADITQICEMIENDSTIYEIMKSCPYELLRRMKIQTYKADEFVLNQEEEYHTIYLVVSGELDIYVESENGKKYYLNTYRKGCYIGELEMFGNHPYVSRVEAKTNIKLLEIKKEDFIRWVQTDRNMNDYFLKTLCESTYTLCRNMGNNTLYSLTQRICQYLVTSVKANVKSDNIVEISSESLAERMAVTQRSVNRILHMLRESGLIEISKKKIMIKDVDGLTAQMKMKGNI
jgi:CRP-like cAMP-binding protein